MVSKTLKFLTNQCKKKRNEQKEATFCSFLIYINHMLSMYLFWIFFFLWDGSQKTFLPSAAAPASLSNPRMHCGPPVKKCASPFLTRPFLHLSDVARYATHAAHADAAVTDGQRRASPAGGGWGPGREAAEVPGEEPGGCHQVQAEEKSVGDVSGEEGGGTDADQHAASGTQTGAYRWKKHRSGMSSCSKWWREKNDARYATLFHNTNVITLLLKLELK